MVNCRETIFTGSNKAFSLYVCRSLIPISQLRLANEESNRGMHEQWVAKASTAVINSCVIFIFLVQMLYIFFFYITVFIALIKCSLLLYLGFINKL